MKSADGRIEDAVLDRRLAALERSAEPPPEAWNRVRAATIARRRFGRPVAVAASLAAAAALSLFLLAPPAGPPGSPGPSAAEQLVRAEVRAMQRLAPMHTAAESLPAGTDLAAALEENRAAIEGLLTALEADPDNRLLLDFLADARRRQARLINRGVALNHETRWKS